MSWVTLKLPSVEEEVLGKAYDDRLMRRLLRYLRPYRGAVAVSLAFLLVQSLLQVVGPLLTKLAIDRYLAKSDKITHSWVDPMLSADPWRGLTQISALYLGALLLGFVCEVTQTYLMARTGQRAMFDLRRGLITKLQRLHLSYYHPHPLTPPVAPS